MKKLIMRNTRRFYAVWGQGMGSEELNGEKCDFRVVCRCTGAFCRCYLHIPFSRFRSSYRGARFLCHGTEARVLVCAVASLFCAAAWELLTGVCRGTDKLCRGTRAICWFSITISLELLRVLMLFLVRKYPWTGWIIYETRRVCGR